MNHDIPSRGYLLPVAADDLAQAPPHAVAHHRAAQCFFDAEPVAAILPPTGVNENSEVGTLAALSGAIHFVDLALPHQPRFARKRQARRGARAATRV